MSMHGRKGGWLAKGYGWENVACSECNGSGLEQGAWATAKCRRCHGTGVVAAMKPKASPIVEASHEARVDRLDRMRDAAARAARDADAPLKPCLLRRLLPNLLRIEF